MKKLSDIQQWLASQPVELQQEIQDIKQYMNKPCTLAELEELDNKFINNAPSAEVVNEQCRAERSSSK